MTVRFAPSPTGRFHIGNLRTAWISHKIARELDLPWWVRFEDIDRLRVVPGAQEQQLADLKILGLIPDHIEIQSQNLKLHWKLFTDWVDQGIVFPCICSRKEVQEELAQIASAPHLGPSPSYPGTCFRRGSKATLESLPQDRLIAWRIQPSGVVVARTHSADLTSTENSLFEPAYHWACAIDDARASPEHGIIVRAWDLEHATSIQRMIQKQFLGSDYIPPAVFHTALVTQDQGARLEKRTLGVTLSELTQAGVSTQTIAQAFDRTFSDDSWRTLERSAIAGESKRTMRVSDLFSITASIRRDPR